MRVNKQLGKHIVLRKTNPRTHRFGSSRDGTKTPIIPTPVAPLESRYPSRTASPGHIVGSKTDATSTMMPPSPAHARTNTSSTPPPRGHQESMPSHDVNMVSHDETTSTQDDLSQASTHRSTPTMGGSRPRSLPPQGVSQTPQLVANLPYRIPEHPYPRDRLDSHVMNAVKRYSQSTSYEEFIKASRGKGDLHPDVGKLRHPAKDILAQFHREGVPAVMKPPNWTPERKAMARDRGPHKSANTGIEFLREEFADMIDKEQWVVLPLELVEMMPNLRLSPLGLVPQRGRRDRMICDYSFFGVNADTDPRAAKEAMQFGRALQRVLYKIHRANPRFGPVHLCKIDLSDGFYRLWVNASDTIHLAVLLPKRENETPLVGIPLTNPMGWVESPPNFCTCTETVADLANMHLQDPTEWRSARKTPHRLDLISESKPAEDDEASAATGLMAPDEAAPTPFKKPLGYWDIYVDDFLGVVQGNKWRRRAVKRILLRALDQVFRPLEAGDNPHRQEPASLKKMKKGDATWMTRKTILGWDVDTVARTIVLPPHRVERLHEILKAIKPQQKSIAVKDWHKIIGELRSMSMAIPGAVGLFSILQEAFRHVDKDRPRIRLSRTTHGFLEDFRELAKGVAARPTRIAELIPDTFPAVIGACDAAGEGMGGVHFLPCPNGKVEPVLWRQRFPKWVQNRLVSWENPKGDITNSDLELAGSVAHNDILARYADVTERTVLGLYDNTATVHWQRKGATTTLGPAAYLLRMQALHQRHYRYVPTRDYIPGTTLDPAQPHQNNTFESDVRLVQEAMRQGVSTAYRARKDKHLKMWDKFCMQENIPPDLNREQLDRDPIDYLQVFGARYRDGRIAPRGKPVKSRTVEDALRSVGQSFSILGSPDPTKDNTGRTDFRIRTQLRSYAKADPPPYRAKPTPITIVIAALEEAHNTTSSERQAIADMMCIAFYFCLRPGEYTGTTTDDQAFSLDDVTFLSGTRLLNNKTATDREIKYATAAQLYFTTQKNERKGTVVAQGKSEDPLCCPVTALGRMFLMHRNHNRRMGLEYDGAVKLASYYDGEVRHPVKAKQITSTLRHYASILEPKTGIPAKLISARSLRAGGAMALLMGGCDAIQIKLHGRWNSDAMMCYLHQEAMPIFKRLACRMYNNGKYAFSPSEWVPSAIPPGEEELADDIRDASPGKRTKHPTTPRDKQGLSPLSTDKYSTPVYRYSRRTRNEPPQEYTPPEKALEFGINYDKNRTS